MISKFRGVAMHILGFHVRCLRYVKRGRFDRALRELKRAEALTDECIENCDSMITAADDLIERQEKASEKVQEESNAAGIRQEEVAEIKSSVEASLKAAQESKQKLEKEKELTRQMLEDARRAAKRQEDANIRAQKMSMIGKIIGAITPVIGTVVNAIAGPTAAIAGAVGSAAGPSGKKAPPKKDEADEVDMGPFYDQVNKQRDIQQQQLKTELELLEKEGELVAALANAKTEGNTLAISLQCLGVASVQLCKVKVAFEGIKSFYTNMKAEFDKATVNFEGISMSIEDLKEDVEDEDPDSEAIKDCYRDAYETIDLSFITWLIIGQSNHIAYETLVDVAGTLDAFLEDVKVGREAIQKQSDDIWAKIQKDNDHDMENLNQEMEVLEGSAVTIKKADN